MSQYTVGNVTLVQNSATVVGASTDWVTASNVKIGDYFKKQGENAWYQVTSVNLATNINISPAYAAASVAGVSYLISRDFTPNYSIPEITGGDYDWHDVYTRAMRKIDTQLAIGVGGLASPTVQSITASYRILDTSGVDMVVASSGIGGVASVWLPDASISRNLKFAVASSGGYLVVIASTGDSIEGNASIGLRTTYDTAHLQTDKVKTWYIF